MHTVTRKQMEAALESHKEKERRQLEALEATQGMIALLTERLAQVDAEAKRK